jgi:hypothetical protein
VFGVLFEKVYKVGFRECLGCVMRLCRGVQGYFTVYLGGVWGVLQ